MKDKIQGVINSAKKLSTLTNILIIVVICILIYFVYQIVSKCYFNDPVKEGFVAQKELTDLLDKLRVKLYEKESVWTNELFNEQPDRKERTSSFWESKNETGQSFKKAGQCISVDEGYDMPSKNTMLLNGDVKPPRDAKMLFQFPDNIITRNEKDSKEYNVYTGIRRLTDIEERLETLNGIYQKLSVYKEKQLNIIDDIISDNSNNISIKFYQKEKYFNETPIFTITNNNTFTIPNGKYSSISIPFGSKLTLNSEHSNTPFIIDLPSDLILNNSGELKELNTNLYNAVVAKLGINGDDFNVFGKYGLGAVKFYENSNVVNGKGNSSESKNFAQSTEEVYSPYKHSEASGEGFSRILGFTNIEAEVKYSFNYAISDTDSEHTLYGRKDLFEFVKKLDDSNKINPISIYKDANFYNFKDNTIYKLRHRNTATPLPESNSEISHPYISNDSKEVKIDITKYTDFIKNINELNNKDYWFNIDIDNSLEKNNEIKITSDTYYVNLAFMFTTMKKKLQRTGEFASDINGSNCCKVAEITEESLSRRSDFQGYLTSGTASLNISEGENPTLNSINKYKSKLVKVMDDGLNKVSTMINQLDNLKRDILENRFQHFPLKIYRPIPSKNYVSLGDVIYNHRHSNYNLRQPILDNIATIPVQCFKEVRDWLSVDKVYEYRQGDIYLAIFKNPYLQTFKVVTVPDTIPTGRVGKIVACVEGCRLLDDIIESDKCAKKFFKANKEVIEGTNLDPDNAIISRESTLYKNKIQDKQDRINTLKEVSRRLQIQDDKANIINHQYNKQKLQNLVDNQRRNINTLVDELQDGKNRIDINIKFGYDKFQGLITILEQEDKLPSDTASKITEIVDKSARQKLDVLPDADVKDILNKCPTKDTEGLVVKALVESGCYNCYNLK